MNERGSQEEDEKGGEHKHINWNCLRPTRRNTWLPASQTTHF